MLRGEGTTVKDRYSSTLSNDCVESAVEGALAHTIFHVQRKTL